MPFSSSWEACPPLQAARRCRLGLKLVLPTPMGVGIELVTPVSRSLANGVNIGTGLNPMWGAQGR